MLPISGDTFEGLLIAVGRLPGQMREGCCKVNGVLTGPAGNLQHLPSRRSTRRSTLRMESRLRATEGEVSASAKSEGFVMCQYSAGLWNIPEA